MDLFYKKLGKGFPMVIIHGLYGSSDNWMTIAKELSKTNEVYLIDLRNHGNSPHSDEFSISSMTEDIHEFYLKNQISKSILMGHSLGGKIAMEFTYKYQKYVQKLVVVDISPRNYIDDEFVDRSNHKEIINILKNIDLNKYQNRTEALEELGKIDNTGRLKFFMMKNLRREKNGELSWKINVRAIADNLSTILNNFEVDISKIEIPTLFIKAEISDYIKQKDIDEIELKMRNVKIEKIQGASHWVHSEKPDEFLYVVKNFIEN